MADRPWTVGDAHQRWRGYLDPTTGEPDDPGSWILRNLVGARTWVELREREDAHVEARALELLERPVPQTFDLEHLTALHQRLFQDVYEWAGQIRTVDFAKGVPFLAREQIREHVGALADDLARVDHLRTAGLEEFRAGVAEVYNALNTAHPFREGNGRTQRLFCDDLARGAGYRIDWTQVAGPLNDEVSMRAREGDLAPMRAMFAAIVEKGPEREARSTSLRGFPASPGRIARPPSPTQEDTGQGYGEQPPRTGATPYPATTPYPSTTRHPAARPYRDRGQGYDR